MSDQTVVVDLEIDLHNEDETGYLWMWLSDARDPALITPGRIVVGDDDALAMARIVDLVDHDSGTIVHVDVLPAREPTDGKRYDSIIIDGSREFAETGVCGRARPQGWHHRHMAVRFSKLAPPITDETRY